MLYKSNMFTFAEPASDWSDTESIASIDVRSRVQEVLIRHGKFQSLEHLACMDNSITLHAHTFLCLASWLLLHY